MPYSTVETSQFTKVVIIIRESAANNTEHQQFIAMSDDMNHVVMLRDLTKVYYTKQVYIPDSVTIPQLYKYMTAALLINPVMEEDFT